MLQTTTYNTSLNTMVELQHYLENYYYYLQRDIGEQQMSKGKTFMWLSSLILTALLALCKYLPQLHISSVILGTLSALSAVMALFICLYVLARYETSFNWDKEMYVANIYKKGKVTPERDLELRHFCIEDYQEMIKFIQTSVIDKRANCLKYSVYFISASIVFGLLSFILFVLLGGSI